MEARRDDGLTAKQARFAALLAQGWTQAAAYRESYDADNMKPETLWPAASRLAADSKVRARVNELLAEVRLEDIDNCKAAMLDLLSDLSAARQAGNMTAVAALTRLRFQHHGMLRDKLELSPLEHKTDEQLITELAGDDQEARAMLKRMLGHPDEEG